MRERIQIKYKDKPVLLDKAIQDMQKALTENLSWLDCAFGRASRHIEYTESGRKLVYPVAYTGEGEYLSLLPNDNIGNFSWFDIYDPQEIAFSIPSRPQITLEGALVFWYDLSSIYEDDAFLHTEEIKDEILRLITKPGFLKGRNRISVTKIYEKPESVYKGYSIEKLYDEDGTLGADLRFLDKQFFSYPYAGLRIEFTLTIQELC